MRNQQPKFSNLSLLNFIFFMLNYKKNKIKFREISKNFKIKRDMKIVDISSVTSIPTASFDSAYESENLI